MFLYTLYSRPGFFAISLNRILQIYYEKVLFFISGIVFAQRPSHTRDTANKKQGLQLSPQTLFLCIGKDYFAAYAAAFTPAIPPKTTSTAIGFAPLVPT